MHTALRLLCSRCACSRMQVISAFIIHVFIIFFERQQCVIFNYAVFGHVSQGLTLDLISVLIFVVYPAYKTWSLFSTPGKIEPNQHLLFCSVSPCFHPLLFSSSVFLVPVILLHLDPALPLPLYFLLSIFVCQSTRGTPSIRCAMQTKGMKTLNAVQFLRFKKGLPLILQLFYMVSNVAGRGQPNRKGCVCFWEKGFWSPVLGIQESQEGYWDTGVPTLFSIRLNLSEIS